MASLLAALAQDRTRWSRRTAGSDAAVDDAVRRWLADLEAAVAGRWQPLAAADPDSDRAPRGGATLRLSLDGRPTVRVRVEARTATVESSLDGVVRRWQAALSEADANRLATTLPR